MMGRSPATVGDDENGVIKKGPWTPEEDSKLVDYIERNGHGSWRALPKLAGLNRCGKSCRLRWTNYLRPDIKRGNFSDEEEQIIINFHAVLGNKWSAIATHLPGRTDNEIKNYWNTHLRKKLLQMGIDPVTHRPRTDHLNLLANLPQLLAASTTNFRYNNLMNPWHNINNALMLQQTDPTQVAKAHLLHNILQVLSGTSSTTTPTPTMEALNILGSLQPLGRDHNQQLHEYLRIMLNNSQFEGLGNIGPLTNLVPNLITTHNIPIPSTFPNLLDTHQPSTDGDDHNVQLTLNSKVVNCDNNYNNQLSAINNIPTANNSLPALVSASPDHHHQCSTVNQLLENKINPTDHISNPSSTTSTTFEAWGELMDDEAGDSYWRDIIDQATSPSWPIS